MPARDLSVSPAHCIFVDGKLVPTFANAEYWIQEQEWHEASSASMSGTSA